MKIISGANQMSLIRDTEEVIKFLEFVGRKSILGETAVHCRLTACHNLFSVLNEDEDNIEYILSNLDVLINRFRNKNANVRASTLKVYKSRVKSSLEDFKAWSADPFAWERSVTDKVKAMGLENRKRQKKESKKEVAAAPEEAVAAAPPVETPPAPTPAPREDKSRRRVSLPIRPDFAVEVVLPNDGITLKEWTRIGLFLYPYCQDIDVAKTTWTVS